MDERIRSILREGAGKARPKPLRPAWQWAEEKRNFPPGHGWAGPYSADVTPWVREITEDIVYGGYDMCVMCCASQLAKTDGVVMNEIGRRLDERPQPVLYIGSTEKLVLSVSRDRLKPMIEAVPSLSDALMRGKADTLTAKYINGARVSLGWGGSATEPASHSVALAIVDEYDRIPPLKREGDIVGLVTPRVSSYVNGLVLVTSTPLEGEVETETLDSGLTHWKRSENVGSPTWILWQTGTRKEWAWPCPECGEYFVPRKELLLWPEDASAEKARREAFVCCPRCGGEVQNERKYDMNLRGRFVAPGQRVTKDGEVFGEMPPNPICSWWISGLASNAKTNEFGRLAYKTVLAEQRKDDEALRTVINTGYGECYTPVFRDLRWELVLNRCADYKRGDIPAGVKFLVMGSDIADTRIDWVIRGFSDDPAMESWLIDYGEIYGQTDKPEIFRDLERIEQRDYFGMRVLFHGIDSGYRAPYVYEYVTKDMYTRHATKGRATMVEGVSTKKRDDIPVPVTSFSTDMAKSWVHGRLDWSASEPGAWHIPRDTGREYAKQIVAERRGIKNGRPSWHTYGDNHKLDCEAICYIMAKQAISIYGSNVNGHINRDYRPPAKAGRQLASGISV